MPIAVALRVQEDIDQDQGFTSIRLRCVWKTSIDPYLSRDCGQWGGKGTGKGGDRMGHVESGRPEDERVLMRCVESGELECLTCREVPCVWATLAMTDVRCASLALGMGGWVGAYPIPES